MKFDKKRHFAMYLMTRKIWKYAAKWIRVSYEDRS